MKVLYVLGCTHIGSTLLGRILNQHSEIFAAGELQYLDLFWGPTNRKCSCGVHALRCPIWEPVFWKMTESDLRRLSFARLSSERSLEWLRALSGHYSSRGRNPFSRHNHELFRAISAATRASVIIDNSKTAWRLLPLWRQFPEPIYALHLVRSPESQIAARIRRDERSFWRAAFGEYWRVNTNARRLFGGDPRYRKIRYEDLVERPEETVRVITDWLELAPEDPFAGDVEPFHDVGGNIAMKQTMTMLRPDPTRLQVDHEYAAVERLVLSWLRRIY